MAIMLRSLHYLAFGLAFLGAAACSSQSGSDTPSYVYAKTGKRLIDTKSKVPTASSLHCLMRGTCGDNRRMPYQGVSEADLTVLEAWLKCEAPR